MTKSVKTKSSKINTNVSLLIIILIISLIVIPLFILNIGDTSSYYRCWIAIMIIMSTFFILVGFFNTEVRLGILINERNVMSLSRFQTIIWTVIILSAYYTMVIIRIKAHISDPLNTTFSDPLNITFSNDTLELIGINLASLVGAHIAPSNKANDPDPTNPDDKAKANALVKLKAKVLKELNLPKNCITQINEGSLFKNPDVKYAEFIDILQGDDLKNAAYIDISKVQMFFFTIILAVCYCLMLFTLFHHNASDITSFPKVNEDIIALLGISNIAYVARKPF